MRITESYKTAQDFLDNNLSILEQRELENNLIIGISQGVSNNFEKNENHIFLSNKDNDGNTVCSIKTISKAIIGGTSSNEKYIEDIAEYYYLNNIQLTGIVGEEAIAVKFSEFYSKGIEKISELVLYKLEKTNEINMSDGQINMCDEGDLTLITDWLYQFQFDTNTHPIREKNDFRSLSESTIKKNNFFKWISNNETKSIACIVRTTKNYGIIGYVYTPQEERGKGYASSLVYELSNHILQSKSYCGLYADKHNSTTNKIYQNIGYIPCGISVDIQFKE